jgi:glucosylglycerate synthase
MSELATDGGAVVGLLTYQDAATVGSVAGAVRDGLAAHFGDVPTRIVIVDAGSTDGTVALARQALGAADVLEVAPPRSAADLLDVPYHGIPGKARALQTLLSTACDLRARACVVFDGSVRTVSPTWVASLARPIVDEHLDFVSPFFARHPFEGALTKGVVYPLIRAVYGVRLRQPAAGEFACSGALAGHWLRNDLWERNGAQAGIDIWLTTTAAMGDFHVAEAPLAVRTHNARGAEGLDLAATIAQVIGALFADVERNARYWQRSQTRAAVRRLGSTGAVAPTNGPAIDADRLVEAFRLGYRELRDIWTWVLPPRTIVDLKKLLDLPARAFRLDDDLWARVVYDFAIGYRMRTVARDHLLRSLVPLYSGWLASYVGQVQDVAAEAADLRVEALAEAFERQKPYLIARWRWPERLRVE